MVAPSTVPTAPGGPAKGDTETSLDPWLKFCVAADGGSEVTLDAAADGAATSIAQQLRYVSVDFFC